MTATDTTADLCRRLRHLKDKHMRHCVQQAWQSDAEAQEIEQELRRRLAVLTRDRDRILQSMTYPLS